MSCHSWVAGQVYITRHEFPHWVGLKYSHIVGYLQYICSSIEPLGMSCCCGHFYGSQVSWLVGLLLLFSLCGVHSSFQYYEKKASSQKGCYWIRSSLCVPVLGPKFVVSSVIEIYLQNLGGNQGQLQQPVLFGECISLFRPATQRKISHAQYWNFIRQTIALKGENIIPSCITSFTIYSDINYQSLGEYKMFPNPFFQTYFSIIYLFSLLLPLYSLFHFKIPCALEIGILERIIAEY